ncbi:MAG: type II toxin-antitoxin system HicA family toxin [Candidatus Hydrogenedentota bacterium]
MSRLPALSAQEAVEALKKAGYSSARQSGSHLTLKHPSRPLVIVPMHGGSLRRGLLMRIVKQAGFTTEEFLKLL